MSLATQLSNLAEGFKGKAPQSIQEGIATANENFKASYDPSKAIQVGATLPQFKLPNAVGKEVDSKDLLAQGPILISFYRGDWCPFCSLELRALQKNLDQFQAKGVTLVAISPQLPNTSLNTTEKHELKFPVLSDVGNKYAKELGILFQQPDEMRPIFKQLGHDLVRDNGDDSFAIPIPATFLVDQKGVVRNSFIDTDYTTRLEPATALEWIDAL